MFERLKARLSGRAKEEETTMAEDANVNEEAAKVDETTAPGDSNLSPAMQVRDRIIAVLKTVYDPEIPVDIYQLGLIYDVQVSEDKDVKILMTLTSPNCPVAESLPEEVRLKTQALEQVNEVEVEITFEPPWEKDMMSEEAKVELGLF